MKTISIIIQHHGLQIVKELLSSVMLIWELLLKFSIGYDDNDEKMIKDFFAQKTEAFAAALNAY